MRKHTILCINDDENILSAVERVFIDENNYEIITANGGEEGLEILKKKSVDLIITDLYMPGIDGWKLCRLLRSPELSEYNNIPVLVMSATFSGSDTEEITRDLGANDFISVPYNSKELLCAVENLLSGKISSRSLQVLVVEDDESLRRTICECFKEYGYSTFEASDGNQALSLFKNVNPEIIILDYHLPDQEGDILLKRFKSLQSQVAVLVITGDSSPDLAMKVSKMGADAYIRKPFKPQYLIDLCEKVRREWSILRVEKLLEDRTLELQRILETSVDAVMITNLTGCIVQVNNAIERMLGYSREEVIGKHIMELSPKGNKKEEEKALMKKLKEKGVVTNTKYTWLRKNGSLIDVEINLALLKNNEGNVAGTVASIRDITERTRIEEKLKNSEEKYHSLVEFANVGIISTEKGKITQINKKSEEIYGYSRNELIGKSPSILTLEKYKKQHREMLDGLLKSGKAKRTIFEEEGVRKDGSIFPIEISYSLSKSKGKEDYSIISVMNDITERKRAEEELRKTKDHLNNLIESSLDAIMVTDRKGYITRVNKYFLEMVGYREEEIVGKHITETTPMNKGETYECTTGELVLISEEYVDDAKTMISRFNEEGKVSNWESYYFRKEKKLVPVEQNIVCLFNEEGERADAVAIIRDITERKKAEKELQEATIQLVQSEKLASLGELTAGVAHELNQPLNGIKIISQSLLMDIARKKLEEKDLEHDLNDVVNQVNKMADIIDHMRIFTRRSEGVLREEIDLNSIIRGTFTFLGQQLRNHNIEVLEELCSDLPKIVGDPIRLEQVFLNLISNARHAVECSGKEHMKIEARTYAINTNGNSSVVVEVYDNGKGIPEELRGKIFQPFFTTKDPGKGTGLGLSVSNKIIEEHNGKMELDSTIGEGSIFRVILPAVE